MLEPSKLWEVYSEAHRMLNDSHSCLLGRILTLADATFADPVQRKAFKDLVKQEFSDMWNHEVREIIISQFRCVANIYGEKLFPDGASPVLGDSPLSNLSK